MLNSSITTPAYIERVEGLGRLGERCVARSSAKVFTNKNTKTGSLSVYSVLMMMLFHVFIGYSSYYSSDILKF